MLTKIFENLKTLIIALLIAILIRSLFFQPFYIPSSSMEPTLLVGVEFLYQNTPMVIANIHFLLVLRFLKIEYYIANQTMEILLYLKHHLITEQILLRD